jgi:hypothetical protein
MVPATLLTLGPQLSHPPGRKADQMNQRWRNQERADQHIQWDRVLRIDQGDKVCPSDIDGVVERKGCFMFLEWKTGAEKVSGGQMIMLKALAKKPGIKVVVLWGWEQEISHVQVIGHHQERVEVTPAQFISWFRGWWNWADSQ